jgi:hypothetical protein
VWGKPSESSLAEPDLAHLTKGERSAERKLSEAVYHYRSDFNFHIYFYLPRRYASYFALIATVALYLLPLYILYMHVMFILYVSYFILIVTVAF